MVRQVSLLAACALLTIGNARAQTFTGTYTLPNQTGVVTLTLKQDAQGKVTGTLSGNGSTFQIQGEADGEDLIALASSPGGGGAYLEGHLEGNGIRVILAEMGPNNQPRYDQVRELMFTRQGAGALAGAAPTVSPGTGNPLAATAPSGSPLARAAAPDPYTGTFVGSNLAVTFRRSGEAYGGTINVQGADYALTARPMGDRLTGTFVSGGATYLFEVRVQGNILSLLSDGQTFTLQRQGTSPGPTPSAAAATPTGQSPQDTRIAQLLLSSKWCHFSYSGVAGSSSGSSYSETVFFSPDGGMVVQTGGESYYSADVRSSTGDVIARGSTAGQRGGGQQYRWRVQQGMLMISADGTTWQPLSLQITQNSNGYPIVTADGKEYSQCS